jgi:hypothetical protein
MGNLDSEYPTDEQIEESFEAWKLEGEQGLLKFLQEQRRKRETDVATAERGPASL